MLFYKENTAGAARFKSKDSTLDARMTDPMQPLCLINHPLPIDCQVVKVS